jgi:predicted N-formylglutamate amidohydrolase
MSVGFQSFEAARVEGPAGETPVLFLCEHASCAFPAAFGDLGLDTQTRRSHIAWDPGAYEVARRLATGLSAPLVSGGVSRLLYDCNRPPEAADAVPERSEIHDIPGNRNLGAAERQRRVSEIYEPFAATVERVIETAKPAAIVTVHSFTPVFHGRTRTVELGLLHDTDSRLADTMLSMSDRLAMRVERNQPYGPDDGVMHSLRLYGERYGLLHVMLEVRNDLIADQNGQDDVSRRLELVLGESLARCGVKLAEMH